MKPATKSKLLKTLITLDLPPSELREISEELLYSDLRYELADALREAASLLERILPKETAESKSPQKKTTFQKKQIDDIVKEIREKNVTKSDIINVIESYLSEKDKVNINEKMTISRIIEKILETQNKNKYNRIIQTIKNIQNQDPFLKGIEKKYEK
ncbi:hypothetical protein [Thalassospira sp.]|uniref:hypothetical protein n=2 Tax=Thalassospira sp. TaxID=1912094 RepID=UPI0032ED9AAD